MKKITQETITAKQKEWFEAVKQNDIKTVKKMIEEGIDVNIRDRHGWTALHYTYNIKYLKMAKLLLDNGVDVNIQDKDGWTALHYACNWGHIETVKFLIDKGADVNIQDKEYLSTPLQLACSFGKVDIIQLLIERKADMTIKDTDGHTPFASLREIYPKKHEELMQWLAEEHPEKALEVMANENIQSKGIGL